MHFLSCAPLLQQHWHYTGTFRMEGSGSAWQNPFLVSRRNWKIRPWEGAELALATSTGFESLCSNSLFMVGGKSFTIFTFFHDIFNFSYPTWTKILKLFKTAKDFTSSFLLSSKTGGQGTEAKRKRKRIKEELFFRRICDMLKRNF